MKRIEVKLALPVVAPLPDFIEVWTQELLHGQAEEVRTLLALFDEDFFRDGVVAFDADNAEIIVRACAGVRLRLREQFLRPLGDDLLESGDVDLASLDEPVRKAFMCYLFLATIQELIIQHLDDSILEG